MKNSCFPTHISTRIPERIPERISRRQFLKKAVAGAGAAGSLLILPTGFLRGAEAPSNRIGVAAIGVGGMGRGDTRGVAGSKDVRLVGLCDVDSTRLGAALADYSPRFPEVRGFADFREMLTQLGDKADAVLVSTPDHSHFAAALAAAKLGKHLYVQKPICRTVDETRRLAGEVASRKLIAQMGNQGASSAHVRSAREWVEAGLLGEVREVVSWTNRPLGGGWQQGLPAFAPPAPPPADLNWKLWLCDAPARDYSPEIHPFKWRGYRDFGVGALGDMGTHLMFDAWLALALGQPERVEVEQEGGTAIAFPNASKVTFYFPATPVRGAVKYTWFDGTRKPELPAGLTGTGEPLPANGTVIIGSKIALRVSGWANEFLALDAATGARATGIKPPARRYPRVKGGHYQNWIEAIRKGDGALLSSPFALTAPFCEAVLTGVAKQ